ncbi:MAG: hypothetical protein K0U20_09765 [Proteobacteria bacterium]|nr:hypothetical protein [Pseudomonadota bacterium]
MAHFAQIENNLVTQVIVVDNNDILDEQGNESEVVGIQFCTDLLGGTWVQTSYNGNMRKNYAGIGDTYDTTRDAFISPQPFPSWVLDEDTCQWEAPVAYPDVAEDSSDIYIWDEETINWVLSPLEGE